MCHGESASRPRVFFPAPYRIHAHHAWIPANKVTSLYTLKKSQDVLLRVGHGGKYKRACYSWTASMVSMNRCWERTVFCRNQFVPKQRRKQRRFQQRGKGFCVAIFVSAMICAALLFRSRSGVFTSFAGTGTSCSVGLRLVG